ncbi:MAG: hypothetical protein AMJ45_03460 [Syntrophobacter sp. DG_60]|nr:MAG: hypothetical protein AMJ45_03460 [Syntrophobacter sp. DG_60]
MAHLLKGTAYFAMNSSRFRIQDSGFRKIVIFLILFVSVLGGKTYAQTKLKVGMPDLCYGCHEGLKKEFSKDHVHVPVKEGQCTTCHNPHTSNHAALIKDEINILCLGCHKEVKEDFKNKSVHSAFKRGECTDCHNPHSSNYRYILTKSENFLCLDCHKAVKGHLERPYLIPPFREKRCLSCHHAHASNVRNQLVKSPSQLCQSCHGIRCQVNGISLSFTLKGSDCTNCHSGHSSDSKGIFNAYGHSAFLQRKCGECHNPILADREVTTKLAGKELCFGCHKEEKKLLSNINTHMINEENACTLCHNPHSSNRKGLISKADEELCLSCHQDTDRKQIFMEKKLKRIRCVPVKERKCLKCHRPPHYDHPLYLKPQESIGCDTCHKAQHTITHPLGEKAIDPRTGHPLNCSTCHSMHAAKDKFMLYYNRDRALCIQCHKGY